MRLVGAAVQLFESVGEDSALRVLSDTTGPFVQGDLYVFVYDTAGVVVAHSRNPKLVGKAMLDVPDFEGKPFRREILKLASTAGVGWIDYRYRNPVTMRIESKSTWIRRVGRFVVCCGVYL